MSLLLAVIIGMLFASALYMMMRRSFVKLTIGLILIGHSANLLIFTCAATRRDGSMERLPPGLIEEGQTRIEGEFADPLPFALILTAIVIAFAITAFTLVLVKRAYQEVGTDDLDNMRTTDR
ncbi:MAG: Na+/H+ antiporter subunit C [Phycisphaerales bacterium]|nr:Na+/H+ antiporter subunit C [Phycisphaerales bacterium]